MVEFLRVGFDVRAAPSDAGISADALVWPQALSVYQAVLAEGFFENALGLVDVRSSSDLERLKKIVSASGELAFIVEISVPSLIVGANQAFLQAASHEVFDLASPQDVTEHFDACDSDGFFSAFYMGKSELKRGSGSQANDMLDACIVGQAANMLVPSHAPFILVRLRVVGL